MRTARRFLLVAVLVFGLVAVSGCQKVAEKATEKAIENATGNKVDIEEDGVTVEGENGETTSIGENVELPEDFPKDIPVYKGTLIGAYQNDKTFTLQLETADGPRDVKEFYVDKLEGDGWVRESSADTADGAMYTAKQGETRTFNLVAATSGDAGDKTSVSISIVEE